MLVSVGILALVGAAFGSFTFARTTQSVPPAVAQEPSPTTAAGAAPERERFWYLPLMDEDEAKPRLDKTLVGIQLGPDVRDFDVCGAIGRASAVRSMVDLPEAASRAPDLALPPRHMPEGSVFHGGPGLGGLTCGGTLGAVGAVYAFPQSESSLYGGSLYIVRARGPRRANVDVAEDRAEITKIAGRNAVQIHPLTEDGFGESFVLVADPGGLTYIQASGLSMSEVRKIAESLYESGAAQ